MGGGCAGGAKRKAWGLGANEVMESLSQTRGVAPEPSAGNQWLSPVQSPGSVVACACAPVCCEAPMAGAGDS